MIILAVANDALSSSRDILHLYYRYFKGVYRKCLPSDTKSLKKRTLFTAAAAMSFISPLYIVWSYKSVAHDFVAGKIKIEL